MIIGIAISWLFILIMSGGIIGGIVVFLIARYIIRSRYVYDDNNIGPGFGMEEVENMFRKGLISKEEFERLRNIVLGRDMENKT